MQRVLTVGNSFAWDTLCFLPEMARSGDKNLILGTANVGGWSLENHVHALLTHERDAVDPKGRPYLQGRIQIVQADQESPKNPSCARQTGSSLREILQQEPWNSITIQQKSALSFQADSYEPAAGSLIEYIGKYAPQAEILVIQTWAWREDHPFYFEKKGRSQDKMFEGIREAYQALAERYKLRQVPVGTAFQVARTSLRWAFTSDPEFDYKSPPPGVLPQEKGGLNRGWAWKKEASGIPVLELDGRHANVAGKYLAGAVFYRVLFGDADTPSLFVPEGLTVEETTDLQRIARMVQMPKGNLKNGKTRRSRSTSS